MKSQIQNSLPWYFVMIAGTLQDSAQIMNKDMEIIAEVEGKTSEESRDLAGLICEAVNHHDELVKALEEMAYATNNRGRLDEGGCDYNTEAGFAYRNAQELLTKIRKEESR